VADTQQLDWLNWLTPLGLRGTVEPFTTDQWWALAPATGATVVLAVAAVRLSRRREFGAGLISRRDTRTSRLRVRGPAGLAVRLSRASLLAWTAAVAVIGTFFVTIGAGTVERGRDGDVGGFLGAQLGATDPAAGYLAYCATVVGILVSVYAVLSVLNARHSEERGLTDLILTTGVRRWTPLATQAAVTAAGCAVILTVTGLVTAMTAPAVINGDDIAARSIAYTVGQWPATMAVTGCAVLLIGLRPSTAWLAWLPLVASAALALLGDLLRIPDTIQRLGVFRHVPDISAADPNITALGVLLCIGAALCLIGTAATARRDVAL
jgi:ABC-2 type transport system permease protein